MSKKFKRKRSVPLEFLFCFAVLRINPTELQNLFKELNCVHSEPLCVSRKLQSGFVELWSGFVEFRTSPWSFHFIEKQRKERNEMKKYPRYSSRINMCWISNRLKNAQILAHELEMKTKSQMSILNDITGIVM